MNLEQWQRSEKIKAEAEAAAKRTVERVLNAVKEPAMSEFKVGDWAGVKGNSTKWISKIVTIENKTIYDSRGNGNEIEILLFEDGTRLGSAWAAKATPEEKAAGHRINNDIGDDFPIENRISPHCQSKDV